MHYRMSVSAIICFTVVADDEKGAYVEAQSILKLAGEIVNYPGLPESYGAIDPSAIISIEDSWEGAGDPPTLRLIDTDTHAYETPPGGPPTSAEPAAEPPLEDAP